MVDQSPAELSAREREILEAVATGATNQQVAVDLSISINTVKAHLRNIYGKLGVESRTEATLYAIQHGLIIIDAPGTGIVEEARGAASDVGKALVEPKPIRWSVTWLQSLVGLVVCLAAVVLAFWPTRADAPVSVTTHLADAPTGKRLVIPNDSAPRWSARASMGEPRARFALAQDDQTIYVMGGMGDEGWSAEVQVYHVADDVWLDGADKPTPLANMGAAMVDGLIYVPGGVDAEGQIHDLMEVYDPLADAWRAAPPMPRPVCAYAITGIGGGFCVIGGWDGTGYVDDILCFDSASAEWIVAGHLPQPLGYACAQMANGRVYVTGGTDGELERVECVSFVLDDQYHIADWLDHEPMTQPRAGHGMVLLDDSLYVVGGGWDEAFRLNERYDIANDAWSAFNSPIVGEWRHLGLAAVNTKKGGSVVVIGGYSDGYLSLVQSYLAVFRVYIPS